MAVFGWLIAVLSVKVPSVGVQIAVAMAGFVIALIGVIGVLNGAHLKSAIWKG
jgi:uncharacterized membrane protein YjjB (DUF3815 family)